MEPDSVRLVHALRFDKSIARATEIVRTTKGGGEYTALLAKGREVRLPPDGDQIAADVKK